MITHLIVTLAYPVVRALKADGGGLPMFADAMTVIGLILLVVGIIYSMNLHGDFDISRYYLRRGLRSFRFYAPRQEETPERDAGPAEYLCEMREKRAEAFNYPLFLGIVYVLVSAVIVFGFLERNV